MFTRDLVLLVPGLFGFGTFGSLPRRLSYFERVGGVLASTLRLPSTRVLVHAPRPTAPFSVRVASLHARVTELLSEGLPDGPVERIHLIGHSTGGVDVRLLLNGKYFWPGGPTDEDRTRFIGRIGAAVAVSAPHHGSPIALRLRAAAEAFLPLVTLAAIASASREGTKDWGLDDWLEMSRSLVTTPKALRERVTKLLETETPDTMNDVLGYLGAIYRERALLDDLVPWAMKRLNESIAGGELRTTTDFVTVSPPPPLLSPPGRDLLGRFLYQWSYTFTRPEKSKREPFPTGPFIDRDAAPLRVPGASDGVVPSASQAFSGEAEGVILADHLDTVGHFDSHEYLGFSVFKSDANFDDDRFEQVWKHVARVVSRHRVRRPELLPTRSALDSGSEDTSLSESSSSDYDYIVVGSGAGGGTVAANLARAGMKVLLLEAGTQVDGPIYDVPAFHARASEDPAMSWKFFVRHYQRDEQSRRDTKFTSPQGGVFYPRASTVGGCTAHNAMITICPHDSDWDRIAEATNDASWLGVRMREYFQELEACRYINPPRDERDNLGRHGFNGWLSTYEANPKLLLGDGPLLELVLLAAKTALFARDGEARRTLEHALDPNDVRIPGGPAEGVYVTPIATTRRGRRIGTKDFIRETEWLLPSCLTVKTGCLVTRVLLDEERRACGVEYLEGERLYRACESPSRPGAERKTVRAKREIILAGGAFNTPQLLMLSGIGPREEMNAHGISLQIPLEGVGRNLQDRYEVGVVSRMRRTFPVLRGASFMPPLLGRPLEPAYKEWLGGTGLYTTNGVVLSIIRKSRPDLSEPDLFIFGLPGDFRGYYPGYSEAVSAQKDVFTWAILKAHTHNTGGRVTLKSADPCDVPYINFHYFDEGTDETGDDLRAVVEGVKFARRINSIDWGIREEIVPGKDVASDSQISEFVRDEAWGHHACGTAKMGPASDPMAVVDSRFRVHGAKGLRIVDASIFPRIPGFFIVSAIYMAATKAADDILEDALATPASQTHPKPPARLRARGRGEIVASDS